MSEPEEKRPLLVPGTVAFAVVGAVVVAAALSTINLWGSSGSSADPLARDPQVLRPGDLRLSESPGDRTEFVAFMDFECERCAALYPYLDQLQRKYAGEVTFAIRHFPEAGHASAVDAALAVEAAARQGSAEGRGRVRPARGMALGLGSAPGLFLDGESYMLPESFVGMQEEINAVLES